jgi:hypothetical protein
MPLLQVFFNQAALSGGIYHDFRLCSPEDCRRMCKSLFQIEVEVAQTSISAMAASTQCNARPKTYCLRRPLSWRKTLAGGHLDPQRSREVQIFLESLLMLTSTGQCASATETTVLMQTRSGPDAATNAQRSDAAASSGEAAFRVLVARSKHAQAGSAGTPGV